MTELIIQLFVQACSRGQCGGAGGGSQQRFVSPAPRRGMWKGGLWTGCCLTPSSSGGCCCVCAGSVPLGTNASVCEQEWLEFKRVIWLGVENVSPSKRVRQQHISLGRGRNANLRGDLVFGNNRSPSPKAGKCRLKSAVKELRVGRSEVPSEPREPVHQESRRAEV